MKRLTLTLLIFSVLFSLKAQNTNLDAFEPLIGKTWQASGSWGDGSKFEQKSTFEYALNNSIVIVKSQGFIDEEQTKLGQRNHGVRQLGKDGTIKFWEFDVFGGLTEGTVEVDGKNIIYKYDYEGYSLSDVWEYVDERTYNFKVGSYKEGKWEAVYLKTQFKLVEE